jgi:hypothetical protein
MLEGKEFASLPPRIRQELMTAPRIWTDLRLLKKAIESKGEDWVISFLFNQGQKIAPGWKQAYTRRDLGPPGKPYLGPMTVAEAERGIRRRRIR